MKIYIVTSKGVQTTTMRWMGIESAGVKFPDGRETSFKGKNTVWFENKERAEAQYAALKTFYKGVFK
jgi:hypothetical protein